MVYPKRGYTMSGEWAEHFKRKEMEQRTGRSLSQLYLDYIDRTRAAGETPLTFTKWLPRRDEFS